MGQSLLRSDPRERRLVQVSERAPGGREEHARHGLPTLTEKGLEYGGVLAIYRQNM